MLSYAPYNPDLVPSDFYLFESLKEFSGKKSSNEELCIATFLDLPVCDFIFLFFIVSYSFLLLLKSKTCQKQQCDTPMYMGHQQTSKNGTLKSDKYLIPKLPFSKMVIYMQHLKKVLQVVTIEF